MLRLSGLTFFSLLCTASALSGKAASSADPGILVHVHQIRTLSNDEAKRHAPAAITGVVTALSGWNNSFFLEDGDEGISVDQKGKAQVRVGDLVSIAGTAGEGLFAPVLIADRVKVIGKTATPPARKIGYEGLLGGGQDSQWVEVRGVVHSARVMEVWGHEVLELKIDLGGGSISARVHDFPNRRYDSLVDALVQVRGVCGTNFNARRQFVGLRLFVPNLGDVQVEQAAVANPFSIPATRLSNVLHFGAPSAEARRIKVSGTVIYQWPGQFMFLQSGGEALEVESSDSGRFALGDRVQAIGFPRPGDYSPILQETVIRRTGHGSVPAPVKVKAADVILNQNGFFTTPYDGVLVQLEGELIDQVSNSDDQVWFVRDGQRSFQVKAPRAVFRTRFEDVSPGSKVRITGISVMEGNAAKDPISFAVLPRSESDLIVLKVPLSRTIGAFEVVTAFVVLGFALLACVLYMRSALPPSRAEVVESHSWLTLHASTISLVLGLLAVLNGAAVLTGWILNVPALRQLLRDSPQMMPNAAISFILLGSALALSGRRRAVAQVLCLAGAAIPLVTLIEYAFGLRLGVDLLIASATLQGPFPGRMSIVTAVSLLFISGGLLLSQWRRGYQTAQFLMLAAGGVHLVNAIGFSLGIENFFGATAHTGTALHTSITILLLCTGAMLSLPDATLTRRLSSSTSGGVLSRRLLPTAVLVPALLGWLIWAGQDKGLFGTREGLALFSYASMAIFSVLIWLNANLFDRLDAERLWADSNLRVSERHFRELAEAMPQVVWTATASGEFEYYNTIWYEMTGFARSLPPREQERATVLHPDDVEAWRQTFSKALATKTAYELEYRFWDKRTESYRWYLGRGVPIRDDGGAIQHWIGTCTDIHERKESELQILTSERALRLRDQTLTAIFDVGMAGDWLWDLKTDEVTAHAGVWKLWGAAQPMTKAPADWFRARLHPDEASRVDVEVQRVLNGDGPMDLQCRIVPGEGIVRWVSMLATVAYDGEGRPATIQGLNIDITERKLAELRIQESERGLRQLADAMPQIVWTSEPGGRVSYVNARWYEYTRTNKTEPVLDVLQRNLPPEDVGEFSEALERGFASGAAFELDFRFRRASDGMYRWHLSRCVPYYDTQGKLVQWFGTTTDFHEQKTAKERLEQEVLSRTKELRQSLTEKETLLKEIHHRVKNNLQVISSLLRMQSEVVNDRVASAALKESQQRVLSMALIHERLYGSQKMDQIDFGEYTRTLVNDLFRSYSNRVGTVGAQIETQPICLSIEQAIPCGLILNELVANALKYAYPANATGAVSVDLREYQAGCVRLTVSDHGVGLPEGLNWKSSKSLGLPIVDILAQQLGGTLTVSSSSSGAIFIVDFPKEDPDQRRASAA